MVTEVDAARNKLGLSLKPSYLKSLAGDDDEADADARQAPGSPQGIDDLALPGWCSPSLLSARPPSLISARPSSCTHMCVFVHMYISRMYIEGF